MASSLALMSKNRFILGYGAGPDQFEDKAFGYYFQPARIRIEMMREGIEVIQGMMKGGKFSDKGSTTV